MVVDQDGACLCWLFTTQMFLLHFHVMQRFNRWLDSKIESSPVPGMLVYPEGKCPSSYLLAVGM